MADAALFRRCCALVATPALPLEERRWAEGVLLQLRRSTSAAEVCGASLSEVDVGAAFQAAITLKFATLFNWQRLSPEAKASALQQMLQALSPPAGVQVASWSPVKKQALLAIGLYSKKSLLDGQPLLLLDGLQGMGPLPLEVQDAVCCAVQDEANLGLLAASLDTHHATKRAFEASALPALLQRAASEVHQAALSTCATWSFEAAPEGWAVACAQVVDALEKQGEWALALDLAGNQCAGMAVMWEFLQRAMARSNEPFKIASCTQLLKTTPTPAQSLGLARCAAELMAVDVDNDDGLEAFDSLVGLLRVLSSSPQEATVIEVLLESFFRNVVTKANVPDAYDETLNVSFAGADASDALKLIAVMCRDHPEVGVATKTCIEASLDTEGQLDAMHVTLAFATELVRVSPSALSLASAVASRVRDLPSPLLLTDAMRFFHAACSTARLSACEAAQVFQMVLAAVGNVASDPDVVTAGLSVLSDLARSEGTFQLFSDHFDIVCTNSRVPLCFVTGFCRCLRIASEAGHAEAKLLALATSCRDDALQKLASWNLKFVNGSARLGTERCFAALAGLMPLGSAMEEPVAAGLQAKLSGRYPLDPGQENLLACAAPLLAALAKHSEIPAARSMAEQACTAMAALPASRELQDYALDLCEGLVRMPQPSPSVGRALAMLAAAPAGPEEELRCYKLMGEASFSEDTLTLILHRGLAHDDARIQHLAAAALTRFPPGMASAAAGVLQQVLEVALGQAGPLLEQLADAFQAWASPVALAEAASKLLARIGDPTVQDLAKQSFERLCSEQTTCERRTRFFALVAEMRALVL